MKSVFSSRSIPFGITKNRRIFTSKSEEQSPRWGEMILVHAEAAKNLKNVVNKAHPRFDLRFAA